MTKSRGIAKLSPLSVEQARLQMQYLLFGGKRPIRSWERARQAGSTAITRLSDICLDAPVYTGRSKYNVGHRFTVRFDPEKLQERHTMHQALGMIFDRVEETDFGGKDHLFAYFVSKTSRALWGHIEPHSLIIAGDIAYLNNQRYNITLVDRLSVVERARPYARIIARRMQRKY